eukprot:INCI6777.2.p1 GENE.INCI6777.2~~INCI6777.2.p1  ORF type:complete len:519 (+),score=85.47 INCI6777.2:228-1784(+)
MPMGRPSFFGAVLGLCALAVFAPSVDAVVFSGKLYVGDSYLLVGRFPFTVAPGDSDALNRITFDITAPTRYENLVIGLYYENWDRWQEISPESTCVEKLSYATNVLCTNANQSRCPEEPTNEAGSTKVLKPSDWEPDIHEDGTFSASANFQFANNFEVEWFWVTLANCNVRACQGFNSLCDAALMNVEYSISFENAVDPDDKNAGYTHLGADDRPLMLVLIASAALELISVIFCALVMGWLRNHPDGNLLHHTAKILFAAICTAFIGSLLYAIHLAILSSDGVGVVPLVYIAFVSYAVSATMTLLLIIVITKGWTIVRRKISAGGRMKIAAFITTFLVLSLTCIFWAELNIDIGEYATIYETAPGIVLITIRFIAAAWFISAAINTTKRFEKKRGFFIKFFVASAFWILSMPVGALIATAFAEWTRKTVIYTAILLFDGLVHLAFVILFNPKGTVADRFPFHAMVRKAIKDKEESAQELNNLAQGEVSQDALFRMKDITDQLLERFSEVSFWFSSGCA